MSTAAAHDLAAPMQGTIVTVDVSPGQAVRAGQQVMLIESMKMHHAIEAHESGTIERILVAVGPDGDGGGGRWRRSPPAR